MGEVKRRSFLGGVTGAIAVSGIEIAPATAETTASKHVTLREGTGMSARLSPADGHARRQPQIALCSPYEQGVC